jgi:hypothetical protein
MCEFDSDAPDVKITAYERCGVESIGNMQSVAMASRNELMSFLQSAASLVSADGLPLLSHLSMARPTLSGAIVVALLSKYTRLERARVVPPGASERVRIVIRRLIKNV